MAFSLSTCTFHSSIFTATSNNTRRLCSVERSNTTSRSSKRVSTYDVGQPNSERITSQRSKPRGTIVVDVCRYKRHDDSYLFCHFSSFLVRLRTRVKVGTKRLANLFDLSLCSLALEEDYEHILVLHLSL